jgi:hypothetical protein
MWREAQCTSAVGRVSFDPSRDEEARAGLREMVIPRVKEAPGVVAAYWWNEADGHGIGVVFFENEGAAQAGAKRAEESPRPDFVTWEGVEVHEVVGSI